MHPPIRDPRDPGSNTAPRGGVPLGGARCRVPFASPRRAGPAHQRRGVVSSAPAPGLPSPTLATGGHCTGPHGSGRGPRARGETRKTSVAHPGRLAAPEDDVRVTQLQAPARRAAHSVRGEIFHDHSRRPCGTGVVRLGAPRSRRRVDDAPYQRWERLPWQAQDVAHASSGWRAGRSRTTEREPMPCGATTVTALSQPTLAPQACPLRATAPP